MRILILFLAITALQLSSCTNRQVTVPDSSIEDLSDEPITIQSESDENEQCEGCRRNPYVDDVEGDPDFFRKIENGDTNAFETFCRYTEHTYKREDISKLIKYALLLERKYHYTYGYHYAAEGYYLLYERDRHLSDSDKKKMVSYCWKSYYNHDKLESVFILKSLYRGGLDPNMQDEEQYKICDSIIKTWREKYRIRQEENN